MAQPQGSGMSYEIVPARKADAAFILATWGNSWRKAKPNRGIPTSAFYAWYRPQMLDLFSRSRLTVAIDPDDSFYVIGWLAAEVSTSAVTLHYAYVRPVGYQRTGIATALIEDALRSTHPGADRLYSHRPMRAIEQKLRGCGFSHTPGKGDANRHASAHER